MTPPIHVDFVRPESSPVSPKTNGGRLSSTSYLRRKAALTCTAALFGPMSSQVLSLTRLIALLSARESETSAYKTLPTSLIMPLTNTSA